MKNPWDDIPSIWDGWTKQVRDWEIGGNGASCATGYVDHLAPHRRALGIQARIQRMAQYICEHFDVPEVYRQKRTKEWIFPRTWLRATLVFANDELRWTPDQFRDLDRRLEWEHQQAQLGRQIDAIPVEVSV